MKREPGVGAENEDTVFTEDLDLKEEALAQKEQEVSFKCDIVINQLIIAFFL